MRSAAAAAAQSLQSCPTLCDPRDGSPPGSPVPGILQARMLEWVAISFSNAWKWKVKVKSLSCLQLFATPRTAAYQAPPSMGFSRQEYWSGLPLPSPKWGLKTPQTSLQENKLTSQAAPHFPSVVLVTQSCPTLCDPMDDACKAPLSMEFSRQKYWSGLPFPSPRDLSNPGIKSRSPPLQADSLPSKPLHFPNST